VCSLLLFEILGKRRRDVLGHAVDADALGDANERRASLLTAVR
jgi:hypothetical protein